MKMARYLGTSVVWAPIRSRIVISCVQVAAEIAPPRPTPLNGTGVGCRSLAAEIPAQRQFGPSRAPESSRSRGGVGPPRASCSVTPWQAHKQLRSPVRLFDPFSTSGVTSSSIIVKLLYLFLFLSFFLSFHSEGTLANVLGHLWS